MKKTQHKIPRSLTTTRIEKEVQKRLKDQVIRPEQHAALRSDLSKATSEIDDLTLKLAQVKEEKSDQAKRHQALVTELKDKIEQQAKQFVPMLGVSCYVENHGLLVRNWQTFWKWLSTWAFLVIGYVSVYGVPQEILMLVPEANQSKVTAALALIGFIGRFINQSKPKPLPPVQGDADV